MRILIYSINYAPELTGIGKYNGEMAEHFIDEGHNVTVVTAYPYYPEWRIDKKHRSKRFWYTRETINGVDVIRCPIYVPRRVNALTRILHLSSFAITSSIALLRVFFARYDVVLCVQPTLKTAPSALLFAKLKRCFSIMHIQDFELDTMLALMGARIPHLVRHPFLWAESFLLRRFDLITTISNKMRERVQAKVHGASFRSLGATGTGKSQNPSRRVDVGLLPNWADLAFLEDGVPDHGFREKLGVGQSECLFLYSGNIGKKQGLETLVEVARRLDGNADVKFVIVGAGAGRSELMRQVEALKLTNVTFHPLQPLETLPTLLKSANYHLVLQKADAGDLVLPSKLTNILGVGGHAIVTANEDTELHVIATENPGIMTCIKADCPDSLFDAVVGCYDGWRQSGAPEVNPIALAFARKHLDKGKVLDNFIAELLAALPSQDKRE